MGASTAGTATAPNPLSSQVHWALNQRAHLRASPGERHWRGGLQKAAARGLEARRRIKASAKSCSWFQQKTKCLEHSLCARQQGSPSRRPPTPRLESPLLDEIVLFRVGEAVKLAQSLLRTAPPRPRQAGLAGRHPVLPPSPRPGTGNCQPLSPRSALRHRRHSSSLCTPCIYFPGSCKNNNSKKFKLKLPVKFRNHKHTRAIPKPQEISPLHPPPSPTPDLTSHCRGEKGNTNTNQSFTYCAPQPALPQAPAFTCPRARTSPPRRAAAGDVGLPLRCSSAPVSRQPELSPAPRRLPEQRFMQSAQPCEECRQHG